MVSGVELISDVQYLYQDADVPGTTSTGVLGLDTGIIGSWYKYLVLVPGTCSDQVCMSYNKCVFCIF